MEDDLRALLDHGCDSELLEFCKGLPKVELHAHLNGSLRDSTIRELLAASSSSAPADLAKQEAWKLTSKGKYGRRGGWMGRGMRCGSRGVNKPAARHVPHCAHSLTARRRDFFLPCFVASSHPPRRHLNRAGDRSLSECFKLFDVIHQLTTTHDVITRVTQEVRYAMLPRYSSLPTAQATQSCAVAQVPLLVCGRSPC